MYVVDVASSAPVNVMPLAAATVRSIEKPAIVALSVAVASFASTMSNEPGRRVRYRGVLDGHHQDCSTLCGGARVQEVQRGRPGRLDEGVRRASYFALSMVAPMSPDPGIPTPRQVSREF